VIAPDLLARCGSVAPILVPARCTRRSSGTPTTAHDDWRCRVSSSGSPAPAVSCSSTRPWA